MLAEAQRRAAAAAGGAAAALALMRRAAPVVYASADFMAAVAWRDNASGSVYHLGLPRFGGEEQGDPAAISAAGFELVQFGVALDTARAWRAALGDAPAPAWEAVAGALEADSALPSAL
jgi:hypothetical protein